METLKSYVAGEWTAGSGQPAVLVNPTTEAPLCEATTGGIDMRRVLDHARVVGGPALRALSFGQRAEILRALSKAVHAAREELIELGIQNAGNTRGDAKFDIDGASGALMAYADMGAALGEARFLVDGDPVSFGRSSRLSGQHLLVPREGVAVHINAFNFPAWGLAEKAACALLAGAPVIAKPATATAMMTVRMVERMVQSNALPAGALSLLVGGTGDLLARLGPQDTLAFTGSSATGLKLRSMPNLLASATRVNIEADSLNAAVLGRDVELDTESYEQFLGAVVRDATQKVGQKCTAIRRVFVPRERLAQVRDDLADRLGAVRVGDPAKDGVQVGPVATAQQLEDVRAGIRKLRSSPWVKLITGGEARPARIEGVEGGRGFFVAPTLLASEDALAPAVVHQHEVFGPCVTLMPYSGDAGEVIAYVREAQGCLVSSVYTEDRAFAHAMIVGLAPYNGRVFVGSAKIAGVSLGPGTVFPQLVHGGPGHAGGGEELGGLRGLSLYLQRTAVQGYGPLLEALVQADGKRV